MKKRLLAILLVALMIVGLTGCNASTYKKAEEALANGEYDTAIELWTSLEDYEDSATRVHDAEYAKADHLFATGDLDGAIALFKSLGSFGNSMDRVKEVTYAKAEGLLVAGDYDSAMKLFTDLGDYKDAPVLVKEATYGKASETYTQDPKAALELFCTIPDYEDAKDVINKIGGELRDSYLESEDIEGMADFFKGLDPVAWEVCEDDTIKALIELLPAQEEYLMDPSGAQQEQQQQPNGGERTEDSTALEEEPSEEQTAAEAAVEKLENIGSALETLGSTDTALYEYVTACKAAYDALVEYDTVQKLSQQFPTVDQSLGSLAEARSVTDQMKKTYEDLSQIDWDGLVYEEDNELQSGIVQSWKDIMDGCYDFMQGTEDHDTTKMESGVTTIRTGLSAFETLNEDIAALKTAYEEAYQAIPALPEA